jgi:hypothetical protein
LQYIEFDDDYVFLCGPEQMHVYSRRTALKLVSFPPLPYDQTAGDRQLGAAAFAIDLEAESRRLPLSESRRRPQGVVFGDQERVEALVGRVEARGSWYGVEDAAVARGSERGLDNREETCWTGNGFDRVMEELHARRGGSRRRRRRTEGFKLDFCAYVEFLSLHHALHSITLRQLAGSPLASPLTS